jgi:hypothetical protein
MSDELLNLFPNASPDFVARNTRAAPVVERIIGNAALRPAKSQKGTAGRVHIRFVSVRKRLLDPDNISEKWTLDCLRFAGVIQGDEPDKITLETTQRKCGNDEEEKTLIEIFELDQ